MASTIKQAVRRRYLDFMDAWENGERHLAYTLIAVSAILGVGAVLVPVSLSGQGDLPTASDAQRLAGRYMEAIAKVPGTTPPASAAAVIKQYGEDGGTTCSQPLPALFRTAVVQPPPAADGTRRPSRIDRMELERIRTALRVYCPERDEQLAAFVRNR